MELNAVHSQPCLRLEGMDHLASAGDICMEIGVSFIISCVIPLTFSS